MMAAHLMDIFRDAGLPDDACQLLQGGGEIGAHLVRSPKIHLIAFTGSREVGLEILREAYTQRPGQAHVKRVVCEMGGKNAVIVDNDADLDEAVAHVIDSAFGYQGQKCSAASRLILLDEVHDRFLARLVEAVQSLKIGPPEDPRNAIGPVIDGEAQRAHRRIHSRSARKKRSACWKWPRPRRATSSVRRFSAMSIRAAASPRKKFSARCCRSSRRKISPTRWPSPTIRNFALTGGIFSRSPAHIEQARKEFRVGNLYINRGITGAVVERQPFGGLETFRHRLQSRRPGLSFAVSRTANDFGKYFAPWLRAAGATEK